MKKIETYNHSENGYTPFLIREGWQVAQLNYLPKHGFDDIDQVESHNDSDEVFILLEGSAILVEANQVDNSIEFELTKMERFLTYNVPAGTWHDIAMNKQANVIIVEKSNTHLNDCNYIPLNKEQQELLNKAIQIELKK